MTYWVFDPARLARAEAARDRNMARGKRAAASGLERRLTALEQIAHDVRRREIRESVLRRHDTADMTAVEIEQVVADVERSDAWRREGLSIHNCLKRQAEEIAAEFGLSIDEVLSGAGINLEHYH